MVEVLNRLRFERGAPKMLFCDNGSEFTSQIMDLWAYQNGVQDRLFSRPGKPTDNALLKSLMGRLRAECLDTHWFGTLVEAKESIEAWRRNIMRAVLTGHSGRRTPNEFANEIAASRSSHWVTNSRKLTLELVQKSRSDHRRNYRLDFANRDLLHVPIECERSGRNSGAESDPQHGLRVWVQ